MQTVSCPSCGAEVTFRSHASVMAVCEYCSTTVLKSADSVKNLGKMSAVLEDYSPIQIGTSGVHGGKNFNVIGRIQLCYAGGMWNEWYVLFDDGSAGWLGDSSGLYTITRELSPPGDLPALGEITPGKIYSIGPDRYTAAEVRQAECIGGQGELPFKVSAGYRIAVADFRRGGDFITLDYSDGPRPVVYGGSAVTLDQLVCQLLREDDAIQKSAGKYRGKLAALDCPQCGTPIKYVPGVTAHLICQACRSEVDAASPEATVVAAGKRMAAVRTSLELGATAKINGQEYQVLGLMRRDDQDGGVWTEYLLYNLRGGFFWLVETEEGWWRADVMPKWPSWTWIGSELVQLEQGSYAKLYDYPAVVTFAAGAFNWRVSVGDQTRVYEFEKGQTRLAAELTDAEMTWSRSTPVAFDQMKAWFGDQFKGKQSVRVKDDGAHRYRDAAFKLLIGMFILTGIPLMLSFSSTWIYSVLAAAAIYLPASFLDKRNNDKAS